MRRLLIGFTLFVAAITGSVAQEAKVASEDLMVPHTEGVQIFVRNKRPEGVQAFKSDRIAIMMHGATYGGVSFDVPLAGKSWSDYIAARGFDVYSLDLPGYGRSTRPASMDVAADQNAPFMGTVDAAKALAAVVDFVLKRRGVDKVNLVSWSWGTAIAAKYTAENQGKVERLALYAPIWLRTAPAAAAPPAKISAYRVVSREQALSRWLTGVPEDKKATLIPVGWFDMWADAAFATDPKGNGKTLRAPNGVIQDWFGYWAATPPKAMFDPEKITSPVLLVLGEWDSETPLYMAQTLYPLLSNAAWKRHVVLREGTHFIVFEKNRMQLFETVQQFLEVTPPKPSGTK